MDLATARAHIGAKVLYRTCEQCYFGAEQGVIVSVSSRYVFARYPGGVKATKAGDLTLIEQNSGQS